MKKLSVIMGAALLVLSITSCGDKPEAKAGASGVQYPEWVMKGSGAFGGEKGQICADRLALAKAIVAFSKSKSLKEAYENYDKHLLVADIRRKEAYKPGDSKARSKRQSSKR